VTDGLAEPAERAVIDRPAGLDPGLPRSAVLPTYARAEVTIVRGEGCRVWDDGGRAYLDFGGGIAVVGLGHRHPAVTAAAHAQLDALWHASNLYWTEPMLRLAGLLSARMGGAQAFFCNSGAEANEAALKVARKATGRPRILALEGGFHGRTLGALSATGQRGKWEGFGPLLPGVVFARPNDVDSLRAAAAGGDDLAIIILEPILGEGGVIPLDRDFARAAAAIAREKGALLCVDEVQAGLGRTGTFFAYEQLGIEPDLVTLAKGLANGLPIGALLVREGKAAAIGPGDHGSTFGGNPVASAAACAVVEAIDEALLANVAARGDQLAEGLRALAGVRLVRGRGLLVGGLLDRPAGAVVDACRDRGLLVLTAGPDVLRLLPPLVVSEAEVDEALAILGEVLR
jgi:acetylornithine/N-succinyldiaminopimelate aminotransferase